MGSILWLLRVGISTFAHSETFLKNKKTKNKTKYFTERKQLMCDEAYDVLGSKECARTLDGLQRILQIWPQANNVI
jgi:hypothetical protein